MKRALVTGAGVRLGRAIALALARAGYDLVLHANRSLEDVERVAADVQALGREARIETADLSDVDALRALAARIEGPLDLLVNNAGLYEVVPFAAITQAQYRRLQAVNIDAPFFLTQALLPSLRAASAPCIVNIVDIMAERPEAQLAHYAPTKAALVALTKTLALELAPHIRVNGVAPGTVLLPENLSDDAREQLLRSVPLHREGRAEDIAGAVVYLAGAPYVSGSILSVDGARSTGLFLPSATS
jgi:pteridine reductase